MKIAAVAARKGGLTEERRARRYAACLGIDYVDRRGRSLARLERDCGYNIWLVAERDGFYVAQGDTRDRFHLNMAALRWEQWCRNGQDHLGALVAGRRPARILDATYGIGSDALMMAAVSGAEVVALEASWPLYAVGKIGLRECDTATLPHSAAERIYLWHTDAHSYLTAQADGSFDIIYFDPMSSRPVKGSTNLSPVRRWGLSTGMTDAIWQQARRVCCGCIVRKERPFGAWLRRHPPDRLYGGKYSKVCYGVWEHA